jgi:hypothetical protein
MSDDSVDDLATCDPVTPGAAEQLAVALEWLDNPRGFKLDALEACIKSLALLRNEDVGTVAQVLEGLRAEVRELRDAVAELADRSDPPNDGR